MVVIKYFIIIYSPFVRKKKIGLTQNIILIRPILLTIISKFV